MPTCNAAEMDKTTVLTHPSKRIKQEFPSRLVGIDINVHTDALRALDIEQIDKKKANEFVS